MTTTRESIQPETLVEVVFQPDEKSVRVPVGNTLLSAAQEANIYVNSVCGGDGTCGKCKVRVVSGQVEPGETELLSDTERGEGHVLACQARVLSDVEVEVPEAARLDRSAILTGEGADSGPATDPLVQKIFLELEPPSLDSNLPDYERICSAVRRSAGIEALEADLCMLQQVHGVLREADWKITATVARHGPESQLIAIEPGDTSATSYGVAVDVGTTTVVVYLVDLHAGRTADAEARYNSQIQYGEDYIHRIMYVEEHDALEELQRLVVGDINQLVGTLCERNGLSAGSIVAATCAGNTTMLHLLLGLDPTGIRKAPYVPTAVVVPPLKAADVGLQLSSCATLFALPSVGAYVGADITAGALAIRLHESDENVLFIDVGTNGEVVFGNREWMVCCSASAGPAFEGAGVRCGMRATNGAIEKITVEADGRVTYETIGNAAPLGICGSGLIDTVAQLFLAGAIDRTGAIQSSFPGDRVRGEEEEREFLIVPQQESGAEHDIVITQIDIENLLRSKAAVYAAISVLLESVEMSPADIHMLYLAGGFGNSLDAASARTLGLIPDIPLGRIRFAGNTCIKGAEQALLSASALGAIESIAKMMTYFDLIAYPGYMEEFTSAMFIPHTDVEMFPSVVKLGSQSRNEVGCGSGL